MLNIGLCFFIYISLCCASISFAQGDNTQLIDIPDADIHIAVVDTTESLDIDFSFFNNPFAFATFYDRQIKAKFGGYIQYSSWLDSRQVLAVSDGFFWLYPEKKIFDPDCRDINAKGQYNASFLDTRLHGEFYGPKILGAESYAYLETSFWAFDIDAVNRMQIRHAFIKLTWTESELLLGQYWHPALNIKCFPFMISYGDGAPNALVSRNPQIRYTFTQGRKELVFAAAAQVTADFTNIGPIGFSSIYLRNARLPMLIARAAYNNDKKFYAGICLAFERLKPRLISNTGYRVHESINSAVAQLFTTVIFEPLEIRQQLIYAQNATNLVLLGGYAVTEIDPVTDARKYTHISSLSYWIDINMNRQIEPGIFIGITKNLGASKEIIQCIPDPSTGIQESTVYAIGPDINTVVRIAPRIRFHIAPIDWAMEIEYCRATYGCLNEKAQVKNTNPVANIRLLFAAYYYF